MTEPVGWPVVVYKMTAGLLPLALAFNWTCQAGADSALDRVAQAIKASLEETGGLPVDQSLYAARISVSHNWDAPKVVERAKFVQALCDEQPLLAKVLGQAKVTRFITAGDTIVATVEYADARVEGESAPQIAFFLKLAEGKIIEEQVYADRAQLKAFIDALRMANEKVERPCR